MKLSQVFFVILLAELLFLNSCKNPNDSPTQATSNGAPLVLNGNVVSGKVGNWNGGSVTLIAAMNSTLDSTSNWCMGTGTISMNGNFTVTLKTPPDSMLVPALRWRPNSCPSDRIVNDTSCMALFDGIYVFNVVDTAASSAGYRRVIQRGSSSMPFINNVGEFFTYLIYVTRPVTMTGVGYCSSTSGWDSKYIYSLELKAGWNFYSEVITGKTDTLWTTTLTCNEPPNGKWSVY